MCDSRFLRAAALLLFAVSAVSAAAVDKCESAQCPGPVNWYKSLGCKPVYETPGDCCAIRYDCEGVMNQDKKKCYANGHEYAINEPLREEDANPCDKGCVCHEGHDGVASFTCAIVDCFQPPAKPGCFRTHFPGDCCPGEEVCPEQRGGETVKCEVGDKTYTEGESFTAPEDPELKCYCGKGYEGKNVAPFCAKPKRSYCDPYFGDAASIQERCAPVFYSTQSPEKDCSYATRCQNKNDTVIHNHGELQPHDEHEHRICRFGDLVMHLGDELTQSTDYSSVCVNCLCEVPPTPTCQQLPSSECDVTKHPRFSR